MKESLLQRHFGSLKMSWASVLLFSLIVGVLCGVLGGLPFLDDTSFTDMAGGYDWWVVCAVVIVVNCRKWWDAGLKCFTFFLITQPVMFFVQALLFSHNWPNFVMYVRMWMPVIVLTLPGGVIAWLCKKQNVLGSIVLGLGCTIQGILALSYSTAFLQAPPRHLISALFALTSLIIMTLCIQKTWWRRLITFGVALCLTLGLLVYILANGLSLY